METECMEDFKSKFFLPTLKIAISFKRKNKHIFFNMKKNFAYKDFHTVRPSIHLKKILMQHFKNLKPKFCDILQKKYQGE